MKKETRTGDIMYFCTHGQFSNKEYKNLEDKL